MTAQVKIKEEKVLDKEYIIFQPNVTEEEFFEFANEDTNCELIDGVLIIHSPASETHEDIFSFIMTIMRSYFDETKEGQVYGSRFVMRLSKKWHPEPDLLLIKPHNYQNLKNGYLDGPADVVIEILSPSTREVDLTKKVPEFLRVGVQEVLIIDPDSETITLRRKDFTKEYLDNKSDEIIELESFPGLKLKVEWIWKRKEYSTFKLTQEILKNK